VEGKVFLTDTVVEVSRDLGIEGLLADVQVDFTPVLGRQISCLRDGRGIIYVEITETAVYLNFTPYGEDCGLVAYGAWRGDSIAGEWREPAYVAENATGRFVMKRQH
jgi:hypothetical protein